MQKDWFAIFKVKATARAHSDQNMTVSTISSADPFATKFGLRAHYHKLDCLVKRLLCCGQGHRKGSKLQ